MYSIIGVCTFVSREKLLITDEDGDEIEVGHNAEQITDKMLSSLQKLLNKKISYYYDESGVYTHILRPNDSIVDITMEDENGDMFNGRIFVDNLIKIQKCI